MTKQPIHQVQIGTQLRVDFYDRSNRYFGDYHQLLIDIQLCFTSAAGVQRYRCDQPLRRMGVSGKEIEAARMQLIQAYLSTARSYLERTDWREKLQQQIGPKKRWQPI